MILAQQGLGHASAGVVVLSGSCCVLVVAAVMLVWGLVSLRKPDKSKKRIGWLLIAASVLWTVGCFMRRL